MTRPAPPDAVQHACVLGGGSAGWMAAAALINAMPGLRVTLVESEEIGTVGVGEATIPPIRVFNRRLGIDEATFLRETNGTYKLGIAFSGWDRAGADYFHPFGQHGAEFDTVPFYHHWMAVWLRGEAAGIDDYSMAWEAARRGRFARPARDKRLIQSTFDYAYHFDAGLYARFLRRYAEDRGVTRLEGVAERVRRAGDGTVDAVALADGRTVEADFWIDCTGFRALLIGEALGTPYEDWSGYLPADRAVAVPCAKAGAPLPYTRSTCRAAGWQWRIPLQHRTGNGYVYCSSYETKEDAERTLLANLDGAPLSQPRHLSFTTGRRARFWHRNVVAVGLSAGFMEPLESTSLHLIQYAVMRLLALWPQRRDEPLLAREYDRLTTQEYERIRDFLILHYHANRRDEPFWRDRRDAPIPDTLAYKIEHFRAGGVLVAEDRELFANASWLAVYLGQNVLPERAPAIAGLREGVPVAERLAQIRRAMTEAGAAMPEHMDYIERVGGLAAAPDPAPAPPLSAAI